MNITIYRGTKEIGGTLIEIKTKSARLLIDAGYPLFLNEKPIEDSIAKLPHEELLKLGILPQIQGLYSWDDPAFDAVIVSHAHIDHYGLLKYIHLQIPVYLSLGTQKIIELTRLFKIINNYTLNTRNFRMYESFLIGDILIKPYLMDHSAFDAAAFEISAEGKTLIYTGDFRGHGRKAVCLDRFIESAAKQADLLLTEGTMFGRQDEAILTENELEQAVIKEINGFTGPVLFQCSSQNIDRLVSFYKAALQSGRIFIVDIYTANVLYELHKLGNRLPYPSDDYKNIKVFYPYRLTQKIFNEIGEPYAKRFSSYHLSKDDLQVHQDKILMLVRPSMDIDIQKCSFRNGILIYSMWQGYRDKIHQQKFEKSLNNIGFSTITLHTSGHASVSDIKKLINGLDPRKVIPVHTMKPQEFEIFSEKAELKEDGKEFKI